MSYNYKLLISYDGTDFFGWQKTKMGPSIEEELSRALQQILRHPVALDAASRTDRGVHAQGQVVRFQTIQELDIRRILRGLNGVLPDSISVHSCEQMPIDFHPTLDAKGKEYHYTLSIGPVQLPMYRRSSWHIPQPLDEQKIREAANFLLGTHDFSAFTNEEHPQPFCTLWEISLHRTDNQLMLSISGNRFLYKMVRTLVGTLVSVGLGKKEVSAIPELLNTKDRTRAGMTAPAQGLSLYKVFYDFTQ